MNNNDFSIAKDHLTNANEALAAHYGSNHPHVTHCLSLIDDIDNRIREEQDKFLKGEMSNTEAETNRNTLAKDIKELDKDENRKKSGCCIIF